MAAALLLAVICQAQTGSLAQVVLRNGSLITGTIDKAKSDEFTLTIRAANGQTYVYPMSDVLKISEGGNIAVPQEHRSDKVRDVTRRYDHNDTGVWLAVEALGGYSANLDEDMSNTAFAEVNFFAGYRFNQFVRLGIGTGPRYYFNPGNLRRTSRDWALPIMLNVRGSFIHQDYRTVVPYYSLSIGATVGDGFLLRPTIGIRCGEPRSAFLLGVSYMLQTLRGWKNGDPLRGKANNPTSFFALTLGYEF